MVAARAGSARRPRVASPPAAVTIPPIHARNVPSIHQMGRYHHVLPPPIASHVQGYAIGGGSTWWYLPIWWMLGTFLAWMGGIVTAAGGEATLGRRALPALAATIVVALIVRLAGVTLALPVATGGAFTLVLAALALVALARKG